MATQPSTLPAGAPIEVRDLRKCYGTVDAVRGISFDVGVGEVVAVLGPNGAGKTSTVEVLEGFRQRDGGEVRVLGVDPATAGPELRQRVGIVLQECGIDRYLNVTETLQRAAQCYRAPRQVGEVIELVGLTDKATARVKTLSGGQLRRLDMALGLIGDPEVLFLDEPTTGFDPSARRQAWSMITGLRGLGKTVLLTTHYMDEAQALADRIIVIAGGRIVAEGPPATIGGRADAATVISFVQPTDIDVADLPLAHLPPVNVDVSHDAGTPVVVTVRTTAPTATLAALTGWATAQGLELERLIVSRPSLEDVYLQLVDSDTVGPQP
jgi:ABC-2 type transport system ATP-binding protein